MVLAARSTSIRTYRGSTLTIRAPPRATVARRARGRAAVMLSPIDGRAVPHDEVLAELGVGREFVRKPGVEVRFTARTGPLGSHASVVRPVVARPLPAHQAGAGPV